MSKDKFKRIKEKTPKLQKADYIEYHPHDEFPVYIDRIALFLLLLERNKITAYLDEVKASFRVESRTNNFLIIEQKILVEDIKKQLTSLRDFIIKRDDDMGYESRWTQILTDEEGYLKERQQILNYYARDIENSDVDKVRKAYQELDNWMEVRIYNEANTAKRAIDRLISAFDNPSKLKDISNATPYHTFDQHKHHKPFFERLSRSLGLLEKGHNELMRAFAEIHK